jgi:two-component sensor histidine kinase
VGIHQTLIYLVVGLPNFLQYFFSGQSFSGLSAENSQDLEFSWSEREVHAQDLVHETVLVQDQGEAQLYLSMERPIYSYASSERGELELGALMLRTRIELSECRAAHEGLSKQVHHLQESLLQSRRESKGWEKGYLELADYSEGLTRHFCRLSRRLDLKGGRAPDSSVLQQISVDAQNLARRLARRSTALAGDPVRVNLNAIVRQVQEELGDLFESRRVRLQRCRLPDVVAPQEAVTVLFQEIFSNALVHGKPGGLIEVNCTEDAESYHLIVEDDGPGVETSLRQKVLRPFFKAPKPDSENRSGLGLYACQHIVNSLERTIWVSQSQFGGCAVHFTLPKVPTA